MLSNRFQEEKDEKENPRGEVEEQQENVAELKRHLGASGPLSGLIKQNSERARNFNRRIEVEKRRTEL